MIRFDSIALVLAVVGTSGGQTPVNQTSIVLEDFTKRVNAYVAVHKTARSEVHGLKPTSNPDAIQHYEHHLARRIREMRKHAVDGTIFTPEITAVFGQLIRTAMQGPTGARVQESLNNAEPVRLPQLRVNASYPEHLPLQSTPPSVLVNLPKLPPEVDYRVVGHALVLRDVDANLIVDFARNVVP
jgi:hypothetical protein